MKLAVRTNEILREELLANGISEDCQIAWLNKIDDIKKHPDANALIDLLFEANKTSGEELDFFLPKPVIVGSVIDRIAEIKKPFTRINSWPTFLKRNIAELSCDDQVNKSEVEKIFSELNRKPAWVPDVSGFISTRVISMIINEAYFTLEDGVSTKNEIDIAMKLGTNYPYGPFEWSEIIGLKKIAALLKKLSMEEKRYQPSSLLLKESRII